MSSTSNKEFTTSSTSTKSSLQEQMEARKQAKLAQLHELDRLNGREPPVMGANNGSKNSGHGENQQMGKLASAGAAITGLLGALGS